MSVMSGEVIWSFHKIGNKTSKKLLPQSCYLLLLYSLSVLLDKITNYDKRKKKTKPGYTKIGQGNCHVLSDPNTV